MLASSMAQTMGKSKKNCEDFLREFFRLVTESLEAGESLKIKGFGTFKIVDIESRESINVNTGERLELQPYKKVSFTPAKELAALINEPFASFQTVEIDDDMSEEMLSNENNVEDIRLEEGSDEEYADDEITYEAYASEEDNQNPSEKADDLRIPTKEEEIITPIVPPIIPPIPVENPEESKKEESTVVSDIKETKPEEKTMEETRENVRPVPDFVRRREEEKRLQNEKKNKKKKMEKKFGIGFLCGAMTSLAICVIIFMIGCFLGWWPTKFTPSQGEVAQQQVDVSDDSEPMYLDDTDDYSSTSSPRTSGSSTSASSGYSSSSNGGYASGSDNSSGEYDTVTTTRYLTTIAREHYGDFNFWPYIYLENESILGHPDRITPGTRVKVPSLSKYGVSPSNKADVQKAKQKAQEIYSRYR